MIEETWKKIKTYVENYPNGKFMTETGLDMTKTLGGSCKQCKAVLSNYRKSRSVYPEIKYPGSKLVENFTVEFSYCVCDKCKSTKWAKLTAFNNKDSVCFEKKFEPVLAAGK